MSEPNPTGDGVNCPSRRLSGIPLIPVNNAVVEVIRSCGQFIPPDAMSAVASLERLCDLTGVSRQLLKRYIRP